MFPVPGQVPPPGFGIGTASAFSVTVGAADAKLGAAKATSARTARQVDALRISSLSSVDDRSASIRVAPEPCRSGDIEIPGTLPGDGCDMLRRTLSAARNPLKLERVPLAGVG